MELTGIIIISILAIVFIADMFRTQFKNKWYNRGFIDAAVEYDDEKIRRKDYETHANYKFHKKYGKR